MRRGAAWTVALLALLAVPQVTAAQTPPVPKPFPQPTGSSGGTQVPVAGATQVQAPPVDPDVAPTEAMLGLPIMPNAQFITSYDAGQGQRYYLFGTNMSFADVVAYYRTVLKDKGDLVFDEPPVHEFDVGKFREDTMAFPPGVTVKDYTWGGMPGFLNPKLGGQPQRFKTIIQFVSVPR